ncbi:MAG: hypothetical protein J5802_14800 [Butyrivibrio sp.]|nr:hypothetical protein [Butyrivibrio sp.]
MNILREYFGGQRGNVVASALWFLTCYFSVVVFYSLMCLILGNKVAVIDAAVSILGLTLVLSNPLNSAVYVLICFLGIDFSVIRDIMRFYPIIKGKLDFLNPKEQV